MAMLWLLNLADGTNSLLDIAQRSSTPFVTLARVASTLVEHDLLVDD